MATACTCWIALTTLAQQTAEQEEGLPPELRSRAFAIVLLTALLGLIGIVIILLLGVSWRRYNKRVTGEVKEAARDLDPWSTAAQRAKADDDDSDDSDDDEGGAADDEKPRDKGPRSDNDGPPPVSV